MRTADIKTEMDVLEYFPYRYVDRSKIYAIKEPEAGHELRPDHGQVHEREVVGEGSRRRLTARFTDGTGIIEIVWFKGLNYVVDQINATDTYLLFGKPTSFGSRMNIAHPEMERNPDKAQFVGKLMPMYTITEGMKRIDDQQECAGHRGKRLCRPDPWRHSRDSAHGTHGAA